MYYIYVYIYTYILYTYYIQYLIFIIYIIYKIYTILYMQNYIVEQVKNYSMNLLKNNHAISRFVRSSDDD